MNALPIKAPPRGLGGFFTGVRALLIGLKLVLPGGGLFRYAVVPVLITMVVLTAIAAGAFWVAKFWLLELFKETWISWLGAVLAVVMALLAAWFLFVPTMALFAPWCTDPICDRVHARYTGAPLIQPTPGHFMRRQMSALLQALRAAAMAVLIQLPLAVLSLFTGVVGLIAIPANAMIQGAELIDFPLSVRTPQVSARKWATQNFWPVAGLGTTASLLMLVPFLNLFVVPAGAAAATVLMLSTESGGKKTTEQTTEHP